MTTRDKQREQIAPGIFAALLQAHGLGYDPYHRWTPLAEDASDYERDLRASLLAVAAENKRILAREAVACADALLYALAGEEGPSPTPEELALESALNRIESRLQSALDGSGARPWSEEYARDIIHECIGEARDALADD